MGYRSVPFARVDASQFSRRGMSCLMMLTPLLLDLANCWQYAAGIAVRCLCSLVRYAIAPDELADTE